MPSLWAIPETEFDIVPNKSFTWETCTVSDVESDTAEEHDPPNTGFKGKTQTKITSRGLTRSQQILRLPQNVTRKLINYIPPESRDSLRLTCKSWSRAIEQATPVSPSAANIAPPEILLQIFYMLSPRDFDNARRSCSQWMRVSLNEVLLETMLKRAGWWDSWLQDCQTQRILKYGEESTAWQMSRRFATECLLSGRKMNVERPGFLTTAAIDFSQLAQGRSITETRCPGFYSSSTGTKLPHHENRNISKFHISNCGHHLLVMSGRNIYVYRLLSRNALNTQPLSVEQLNDADITPLASITCPSEVISATMDTSNPKIVIAALMVTRSALICDLLPSFARTTGLQDRIQRTQSTSSAADNSDSTPMSHHMRPMKLTTPHYYHNICSAENPPRSVSICPGRRCVAFGSGAGIELHWVDEKTKQNCRKQFPMSQPSEVLHFLPNHPETPAELRLISSLAGPGLDGCECPKALPSEKRPACPFHLLAGVQSFTRWNPEDNGNLSLVRATHCHHYRAIPINDGLHILFIEPRTSLLCIGSDAPIGGPTSLTRALVCVPPFGKDPSDGGKEGLVPTVFAAGSDLSWGLRVVAAYGDRIVLYSVPLDVFNVIRKERERQGDGVMGDSDLARDWFLDTQRSRKRRESLVQNQNGDWEFLLSVSYRPTATMWPFKIYGKEVGRMENVVDLALQTSNGGARVWAFGATGEANIIDIDTYTSTTQRASGMPFRSITVASDGSIMPAKSTNRTESGLLSPGSSRKRKQAELRDEFRGQHSVMHPPQHPVSFPHDLSSAHSSSHAAMAAVAAANRRTSFAACIVDFKIPELSSREGKWVENESECT
ncbi:hypothetical protein FE257_001403 [Aspergillus nanangensis]|uniref:F-box domain-containing protein n=1 Tax=Aspergillus nanangensis TaxID=2582783 RepID=A0AAD4GPP9_ASPNN|nr:hypothetical protein FE257_001403 [Aspergillus nanangensis]